MVEFGQSWATWQGVLDLLAVRRQCSTAPPSPPTYTKCFKLEEIKLLVVVERKIRINENKILISPHKCLGERKQHAGIIFMHAFNLILHFSCLQNMYRILWQRPTNMLTSQCHKYTQMIISPAHSSMHTITNITHCIHIVLESIVITGSQNWRILYLQEGFLKVSEGSESPFVAEKIKSNPKIPK